MIMSIIVGMKCNKYDGICKYFENFLEILYKKLLTQSNLSIRDICGFYKGVCKSQVSRYIACPL